MTSHTKLMKLCSLVLLGLLMLLPDGCTSPALLHSEQSQKDGSSQDTSLEIESLTEADSSTESTQDSEHSKKLCTHDAACPKGQICHLKDKYCQSSSSCTKNSDCPKDRVCDTCRKVCTFSKGGKSCDYAYNCDGGSELNWCDTCIRECRKLRQICEVCAVNEECGEAEDYCLPDQQNEQSGLHFCGRQCNKGTCPPGYKCKTFSDDKYKGKSYYQKTQCVPESSNCEKPGECEGNKDCVSQGKLCDPRTKRCVVGCVIDENCPTKAIGPCSLTKDCKHTLAKCIKGKCIVQLVCSRGRCDNPCQSSEECEDKCMKCKDGSCQRTGECQNDKDCPEKQYCSECGLCMPGCQTSSDCGHPDPKKNRCRFRCRNNRCEEDCLCRNPHIDCPPLRFCPSLEVQKKNPSAPCRKPKGPICQKCTEHAQCGCKKGDDCMYICTKKECKSDADCKGMPNQAKACYNGRCATKKACKAHSDCPTGEQCENNYCAESCDNMCLELANQKLCVTACDPLGDGSECPARTSCAEILPKQASGPPCKGKGKTCKQDKECVAPYKNCGPDGFCTICSKGQVCRGLDPNDPLKVICIKMPPTVCLANPSLCKEASP